MVLSGSWWKHGGGAGTALEVSDCHCGGWGCGQAEPPGIHVIPGGVTGLLLRIPYMAQQKYRSEKEDDKFLVEICRLLGKGDHFRCRFLLLHPFYWIVLLLSYRKQSSAACIPLAKARWPFSEK